jgi:hypothetical protein
LRSRIVRKLEAYSTEFDFAITNQAIAPVASWTSQLIFHLSKRKQRGEERREARSLFVVLSGPKPL